MSICDHYKADDYHIEFDTRSKPMSKIVYKCVIGMKVVRGRDWSWGNQDGGPGNVGVIEKTGDYSNGWVRVRWANGKENGYRIGAYGCFDLYEYEGETAPTTNTPYTYSSPERTSARRKRLLREIKVDE